MKKILLFIGVLTVGFFTFIFGSPRLDDYLKEKNTTINTVTTKLQIVDSVQSSKQPAMQQSANATMNKYALMKEELCKKQYFYLRSNCELTQLSKANLRSLNALLEQGIQDIVTTQNEVLK